MKRQYLVPRTEIENLEMICDLFQASGWNPEDQGGIADGEGDDDDFEIKGWNFTDDEDWFW